MLRPQLRIAAVLVLLGCASPPPAVTPSPALPPVVAADAIARARADSARYPYTAADIAFMQGMIGHHAQALVMARLAPERTANASIRTLAARIINAQQDEITIMTRWLHERQQDVPDTTGVHAGHHGAHGSDMPGMLSAEQLAELRGARDGAFDRLFLRLMIQHHEGAVTMVERLFATDGAAQDLTVFRFASDAQVDQRTEIARMQRMLAALLFADAEP